jgi:hypothetical protein
MADDKIKWFLMSGADAQQTENILKLFEKIKGRPATSEERAELASRKILPGKNGLPHLGPVGTGFGITGVTSRVPKKPS